MSQYTTEKSRIIPFDSSTAEKEGDELDRSGRTIIALLGQAAEAARAEEDRVTSIAQNLSRKLETAEDHATQLEAEIEHYKERAFAAEKWLLRVYKEIEDKFFRQSPEGKKLARQ